MATITGPKVPLYSISDLKSTTDDFLPPYLSSLPAPYTFTQSHFHSTTRLALGYSAVAMAAAVFYADWKLGWDATKDWTAVAVVVYFVLNGALTYWIWGVEAGRVFEGVRKGGQKLTLQSSVQKHKPMYKLKVQYVAPSGQKWEDKNIEAPFTRWFSADGFFQAKEFKQWLASEVDVIGIADPGSKGMNVDGVKAVEGKGKEVDRDEVEVLEDRSPEKGKSVRGRKGRRQG